MKSASADFVANPPYGSIRAGFALAQLKSEKLISTLNQTKWLTSLRGRAGYLVTPSLLAYGTGGVAWGRFENAPRLPRAPQSSVRWCNFGLLITGPDQGRVCRWRRRQIQIPTTQLRARLNLFSTGSTTGHWSGNLDSRTGPPPWSPPCRNAPAPAPRPTASATRMFKTLRFGISYAFGGYAAALQLYRSKLARQSSPRRGIAADEQ